MMDSSTRCSPKRFNGLAAALLALALWALVPALSAQPVGNAAVERAAAAEPAADAVPPDGLQLRSAGESVQLSAALHFELPALVEDALHKGIPVHFVQEARLVSERWYWSDKVVSEVKRYMRLSFQPLTRRWRLHTSAHALNERGQGGVSLGVTFDTLEEALTAMQRITRWQVAELAQLPTGGELLLELQMRIDTAQLPRPLQIGNLGRSGWSLLYSRSQHMDAGEWR